MSAIFLVTYSMDDEDGSYYHSGYSSKEAAETAALILNSVSSERETYRASALMLDVPLNVSRPDKEGFAALYNYKTRDVQMTEARYPESMENECHMESGHISVFAGTLDECHRKLKEAVTPLLSDEVTG